MIDAATQSDKAGISNIPRELRTRPQWVVWKYENRGAGPTKVLYNAKTGKHAKANDSGTWGTFAQAQTALATGKWEGAGFVFSEDDDYTGIDLDGVRNPKTGELTPKARAIKDALDGYAEVSPSGTGVHIFVKGTLPGARRRRSPVEAYSEGRYFTVTGDALEPVRREIPERGDALGTFYWEHLETPKAVQERPVRTSESVGDRPDDEILERALKANAKLSRLWGGDTSDYNGDHSAADNGFVWHLYFWTQDGEQIKRLHSRSGLARRKSQRRDYLDRSINKLAAEYTGEFFDWTPPALKWTTPPTTGPGASPNGAEAPEDSGTAEDSGAAERRVYTPSDSGNAERFVDTYGGLVRYCYPWRKWLIWDGTRWARDEAGGVVKMARAAARSILHDAAEEVDTSKGKELARWAIQSQNETRINAMLSLARPDVAVAPDALDADLWLLNCQNGTVDLRTGDLQPHRPEDLITKTTRAPYDPEAEAPRFERFLQEILKDGDLIAFVRRFAGYTLTGDTSERCFAILHGGGKNGKSTLVELLQHVLGDYSRNTDTETILKKNYSGVGNDVAALAGARFVSAAEVEKGRHLAESKVKNLTGSDTITARFLFGENFDFRPQFKLWLSTNNKPEIQGTDNAIWDRIKLIPFGERFEGTRQDSKLPETLQAEAAGVLAWAVRGCLEWVFDGLGSADVVDAATQGYREEMDVLGAFLSECCTLDADETVEFSTLWGEYTKWCFASGEKELSKRAFGTALTDRGIPAAKGTANAAIRVGITVESAHRDGSYV